MVFGMLAVTGLSLWHAPEARIPWLIVGFLSFFGIIVFDSYKELLRSWTNAILYLLIYALALQSCLEISPENFWRDQAGGHIFCHPSL